MDWDAFFVVHSGLEREGPGTPDDVRWAMQVGGVGVEASVGDLCCGPGADLDVLAQAVPRGRVLGIEKHIPFVAQARARVRAANIAVEQGDMATIADHPDAPFDAIWCAGALYFLGLKEGLRLAARALKPGGVLAFSEPCYFTDTPTDAARDFWEGYDTQSPAMIAEAVTAAGFEVIAQRPVSDAGWETYYGAQDARIAELRTQGDAALTPMLDLCAAEGVAWRAVREETGYVLTVARRVA